jgi:signal recognition particle GTPase
MIMEMGLPSPQELSSPVRSGGAREEQRLNQLSDKSFYYLSDEELDRMKEAVTRTRENLSQRIEEVVSFGKEIDRATLDDLEATLIGADLGGGNRRARTGAAGGRNRGANRQTGRDSCQI